MSLRLFLISLALFLPVSSFAIPPYFCNGIVRQRPCDAPFEDARYKGTAGLTKVTRPKQDYRAQFVAPYAKIIDAKLVTLSNTEGMWRGYVEGNGKIVMTLEITHADKQIENLPMGQVELKNKRTSFAYKGFLPQQLGWSWSIIGKAK